MSSTYCEICKALIDESNKLIGKNMGMEQTSILIAAGLFAVADAVQDVALAIQECQPIDRSRSGGPYKEP